MPPRGAPRGGPRGGGPPADRGGGPGGRGGGPPRGAAPGPRGGGPPRGGGQPRGAARGGAAAGRGGAVATGITIARDIQTIGVPRPSLGRSGRAIKVWTNHFATTIPEAIIFHYDGAFFACPLLDSHTHGCVTCGSWYVPSYPTCFDLFSVLISVVIGNAENKNPARLNIDIIRSLQTTVAPGIFTPRGVYDGRKNMFTPRKLPFPGDADVHEVRERRFRRVLKSHLRGYMHSSTSPSTTRTVRPTQAARRRPIRSSSHLLQRSTPSEW
jgi:eukaryotic translation initiation factor 2C